MNDNLEICCFLFYLFIFFWFPNINVRKKGNEEKIADFLSFSDKDLISFNENGEYF